MFHAHISRQGRRGRASGVGSGIDGVWIIMASTLVAVSIVLCAAVFSAVYARERREVCGDFSDNVKLQSPACQAFLHRHGR